MNEYNQYEPYEDDYRQTGDEPEYKSSVSESSLYSDGEDKKPKLIIIVVGIVLLLIILLIILFACSKTENTKISTELNTVTISNGEINPKFDKNTLEYEVVSEKDSVIIRCSAESSKATVSGCNKQIYLSDVCKKHNLNTKTGIVATGDQFIADNEKKEYLKNTFNALCAEMEGGSIGHVCMRNNIDFCVLRAISDSADNDSSMDFPKFAKLASEKSSAVTIDFISSLIIIVIYFVLFPTMENSPNKINPIAKIIRLII